MNDKERAELESLRLVVQAVVDYCDGEGTCSLCGSIYMCMNCQDVWGALEEHDKRMKELDSELICEGCGSISDSVVERECGYALDVHGVSALETVCDSCEQAHCDDI